MHAEFPPNGIRVPEVPVAPREYNPPSLSNLVS